MHPEMLRKLSSQRDQEMRARARQFRLGRMARRAGRLTADAADGFVPPAIPDYVDGSFRSDDRPASGLGRAPAARHAA